jgi:hypothetical protein
MRISIHTYRHTYTAYEDVHTTYLPPRQIKIRGKFIRWVGRRNVNEAAHRGEILFQARFYVLPPAFRFTILSLLYSHFVLNMFFIISLLHVCEYNNAWCVNRSILSTLSHLHGELTSSHHQSSDRTNARCLCQQHRLLAAPDLLHIHIIPCQNQACMRISMYMNTFSHMCTCGIEKERHACARRRACWQHILYHTPLLFACLKHVYSRP